MSNETTASKAPTYAAYQVRSIEGKKAQWNRIGSAWQHKDGKGLNILLDLFPQDGRIALRTLSES